MKGSDTTGFFSRCALPSAFVDAVGRQRLARYMIRCPLALEKMRYDP